LFPLALLYAIITKKFKTKMLELGIDVDKLMDEKAAQLITDENMETLRQLYKTTVGGL